MELLRGVLCVHVCTCGGVTVHREVVHLTSSLKEDSHQETPLSTLGNARPHPIHPNNRHWDTADRMQDGHTEDYIQRIALNLSLVY